MEAGVVVGSQIVHRKKYGCVRQEQLVDLSFFLPYFLAKFSAEAACSKYVGKC